MTKMMRVPEHPKIYRARLDYDLGEFGMKSQYFGPYLRKALADQAAKRYGWNGPVVTVEIEESDLNWSPITT